MRHLDGENVARLQREAHPVDLLCGDTVTGDELAVAGAFVDSSLREQRGGEEQEGEGKTEHGEPGGEMSFGCSAFSVERSAFSDQHSASLNLHSARERLLTAEC